MSLSDTGSTITDLPEAIASEMKTCVQGISNKILIDLSNLETALETALAALSQNFEESKSIGEKAMQPVSSIEGAINAVETAVDTLTDPFINQLCDFIFKGEIPQILTSVKFLTENNEVQKIKEGASDIQQDFATPKT